MKTSAIKRKIPIQCARSSRWLLLPRQNAFGLAELLAVIVIILVLASLLYPCFKAMRDGSKEVQCLQNVRTFGNAVLASIADNNGRLQPPIITGPNGSYFDCGGLIYPYYLSNFLYCPNHTDSWYGNYGMNYNLCQYFPNLNSLRAPHSRVVLAAELYAGPNWSYSEAFDVMMWGTDVNFYPADQVAKIFANSKTAQYHGSSGNRGLNLFMLDGSAALIRPGVEWGWGPGSPAYGNKTNGGYYYDINQFTGQTW